MSFTKDGSSVTLFGITEEPTLKSISANSLTKLRKKKKAILCGHLFSLTSADCTLEGLPPAMDSLLSTFNDAFREPTGLPPMRECDHSIVLKSDVVPVNLRLYRISHSQKGTVQDLVSLMLSTGIIQSSYPPFSSPIM